MPPKNTLLGMTTAEPVSTGVHSNINNLLAQSDKTHLWQKALGEIEKGMSNYKHPDPITGTVPDVALSPLLAAKSIPNLLKMIRKINLKNPLYHHTRRSDARRILEDNLIEARGAFPTPILSMKKLKESVRKPVLGVSVTRDPLFLQRPHSHIGTDVRFIMDRDELIRKGYKLKPFAEKGFPKVNRTWNTKEYIRMNPRFEFEERIRGNIPTKDIKLIDLIRMPSAATMNTEFHSKASTVELLNALAKSNIPIIRPSKTTMDLNRLKNVLHDKGFPRTYSYPDNTLIKPESIIRSIDKVLKSTTY